MSKKLIAIALSLLAGCASASGGAKQAAPATPAISAGPTTARAAATAAVAVADTAAGTGDVTATSVQTTDPAAESTTTEMAGMHHHGAESNVTYADLPADTKAEVDQVIAAWATKFPTAADAMADGWIRGTRSLYGIGAHYVKVAELNATTFELLKPNILLYDGDGPDAKFAGVSWVMAGAAPEGFTGGFDVWHAHSAVCLAEGGVVSLIEENSDVWLSESDCLDKGGRLMPLGGDEMMHLWIGPGYIDTGPIMSHDHPLLLDGFNPKRDMP